MDVRIEKKNSRIKLIVVIVLSFVIVFFMMSSLFEKSSVIYVDKKGISVGVVGYGDFSRYISTRGKIEFEDKFILSSVVSGQVRKVVMKPGDIVDIGDAVVELDNPQLQFDVLAVEGQLYQQSNMLLSTEIALKESIYRIDESLIEIKTTIDELSSNLHRSTALDKHQAISKAQVEDMQRRLKQQKELLRITNDIAETERTLLSKKLMELTAVDTVLKTKVQVAQKLIENLVVRSPIRGELVSLDAKLGELKDIGAQIGVVANRESARIFAEVDEFYAKQLNNSKATLLIDQNTVDLQLDEISPLIENGKLKAWFKFASNVPSELRENQSFPMQIFLDKAKKANFLPIGSFLTETGGVWIYVLNNDSSKAVRRNIKLGERNSQSVEVIEGLQAGEKVVISSYEAFNKSDELIIR